MFTWISKSQIRRVFGLGAVGLVLASCEAVPDVGMRSGTFNFLNRAPEKIAVAGRSVVIAGPPGYCVDSSATRDNKSGAFVLLGSCASIANNVSASKPAQPGMLTASVSDTSGAEIETSQNRLRQFFTSDAGKVALARDGNAESVQIIRTLRRDGAFYVYVRDTSDNMIDSLSPEYWRGLFDVRGRIITVSVIGFKSNPMSDKVGLATLDAFAGRIRAENPPITLSIAQTPEI